MHEMGIAESVLDIVRQYVPEPRGQLVRRVTVRVGEFAGVQVESLRFCFEAIVAETPYPAASLAIEWVPASNEMSVSELELDDEDEGVEGQVGS
jgi:hydrogenase nickel incorporation protein HypA/HybF